jgi:hypothetical protein
LIREREKEYWIWLGEANGEIKIVVTRAGIFRQIKRPQTALINPMEESLINCWVRQVRQIRLVFAVRLTTLLLLAGGGVMSLAAQSLGQEQALKQTPDA